MKRIYHTQHYMDHWKIYLIGIQYNCVYTYVQISSKIAILAVSPPLSRV